MLYSTKINDFGSTELGVYGVFDTEKKYFEIFCSFIQKVHMEVN
jgi:hypothetical protein